MKHLFIPVLWLLAAGAVHAYGACPDGQYPASLPNEALVCKPIPVLHWGAIAFDAMSGGIGTSADLANKQQAEQAALDDCKAKGSTGCKVQISYGNGCGALVTNGSAFYSAAHMSEAEATAAAMKQCQPGSGDCKLVIASCSAPPQRS